MAKLSPPAHAYPPKYLSTRCLNTLAADSYEPQDEKHQHDPSAPDLATDDRWDNALSVES